MVDIHVVNYPHREILPQYSYNSPNLALLAGYKTNKTTEYGCKINIYH